MIYSNVVKAPDKSGRVPERSGKVISTFFAPRIGAGFVIKKSPCQKSHIMFHFHPLLICYGNKKVNFVFLIVFNTNISLFLYFIKTQMFKYRVANIILICVPYKFVGEKLKPIQNPSFF